MNACTVNIVRRSEQFAGVRACPHVRRRVSQRKVLPRTPANVYHVIADIEQYPQFLPWCSHASIETRQPAHSFAPARTAPPGDWVETIHCLVDFNFGQFAGIPPASLGGVLHEEIHHHVWLQPGRRVLSVALDSQFCERICYDWRISELDSGETVVELEFEIVLRSLVHAPAWDLFAKGIVSKVTNAFVKRVDEMAFSTPPANEECGQTSDANTNASVMSQEDHLAAAVVAAVYPANAPKSSHNRFNEGYEKQHLPDETLAANDGVNLGAAVSITGPSSDPAPDSIHSSEQQRQTSNAPARQRYYASVDRTNEQLSTTARSPQPPQAGHLSANLVLGASSWLLNTTASVVGVPLRVVPSATAAAQQQIALQTADYAPEMNEKAAQLALRRRPRAELIKELQVLERRVAALKSALREQSPAACPPPDRL